MPSSSDQTRRRETSTRRRHIAETELRTVGRVRSYQLSELNTAVDVAVDDGPPAHLFGALTRCVPQDWAIDQMRPGASIYVDDLNWRGERQVVAAVRAGHSQLEQMRLPCAEAVIRLRSAPASRANGPEGALVQ